MTKAAANRLEKAYSMKLGPVWTCQKNFQSTKKKSQEEKQRSQTKQSKTKKKLKSFSDEHQTSMSLDLSAQKQFNLLKGLKQLDRPFPMRLHLSAIIISFRTQSTTTSLQVAYRTITFHSFK